jgi:hypothetical protein
MAVLPCVGVLLSCTGILPLCFLQRCSQDQVMMQRMIPSCAMSFLASAYSCQALPFFSWLWLFGFLLLWLLLPYLFLIKDRFPGAKANFSFLSIKVELNSSRCHIYTSISGIEERTTKDEGCILVISHV